MVGVKKVNIVITIPPFFVHTTPAIFFSWNQPRQRDMPFFLSEPTLIKECQKF